MTVLFLLVVGVLAVWALDRYLKFTIRRKGQPAPGVKSRAIHTKVVGVTFPNADGTDRQHIIKASCRPGTKLEIRPEPNNPKSATALAVWTTAGQIGYIGSGRLNDDVNRLLSSGVKLDTTVVQATGGTKEHPTLGVNITINVPTS